MIWCGPLSHHSQRRGASSDEALHALPHGCGFQREAVPQQRAHEVAARRPLRVDDEDGRPLLERLGDAGAERRCEARSNKAVGDEQEVCGATADVRERCG